MLTGSDGASREVDVVIRSEIAGYETIVAVEATDRRRPADRTWVEQVVAKHRYLPTSLLVLVSRSGFTKTALEHAERENAVPLALDSIDPDEEGVVLKRLTRISPRTLRITPQRASVLLEIEFLGVTRSQPAHRVERGRLVARLPRSARAAEAVGVNPHLQNG